MENFSESLSSDKFKVEDFQVFQNDLKNQGEMDMNQIDQEFRDLLGDSVGELDLDMSNDLDAKKM